MYRKVKYRVNAHVCIHGDRCVDVCSRAGKQGADGWWVGTL